MAADIAVRPGERIRTGKGVVTLAAAPLTVGEDPRAAFTAAALPATRVALGPGTVVQLTKRESALALERGECFASVDNTLAILLPAGRVEIYSGEVGVAVGYSGRVQVAALTGNASLFLPAGRVDLDPGQRVSVDRKGRAGRARKGAKTPRWTRGLRKAEQVLYLEAFNAWNPTYMSPQGALQRGVAISERTGNESVVRFGRSEDTGGLFRHEGPLRIRVRYRLSDAAPITLQIMNHTQRDNYHTVLRAPRVGLWTDAVFRVERFEDNEKRGKKPRDGDLWGYVALRTPAARLEVDEVSLYRIR